VYRPLAALVTGFVGGGLVHALDPNGEPESASGGNQATACTDSCCEEGDEGQSAVLRVLRYGFVTLPRDIGKALVVGIVLSGLISALVEPNTLRAYLGTGFLPLLAAMAIGVPLYVCATASTPIALGLIHAGLSPGAALVFLVTGPATNGAALAALWKVLGRRTAIIYLATVAVCALGSGMLVDALVTSADIPASVFFSPQGEVAAASSEGHAHHMGWFQHLSAAAMLAMVANALWPRRRRTAAVDGEETKVELKISGMRCEGCVDSVSRALRECAGVTSVDVDLTSGVAVVAGEPEPAQVREAVTGLGFTVEAT
jgi:copper chaperone CopZ